MLTSLRKLRHLSIIRTDGYLMPIKNLSIELRGLSPHIEWLEIVCREIDHVFFNYTLDSTQPYITTNHALGETKFWDVGAAFPRLHTLKIGSSHHSSSPPQFGLTDLAVLPHSLQHLTWTNLSAIIGNKLPPNLTELNSFQHTSSLDNTSALKNLPTTLTSLAGIYMNSVVDVQSLPRSVTYFERIFRWSSERLSHRFC